MKSTPTSPDVAQAEKVLFSRASSWHDCKQMAVSQSEQVGWHRRWHSESETTLSDHERSESISSVSGSFTSSCLGYDSSGFCSSDNEWSQTSDSELFYRVADFCQRRRQDRGHRQRAHSEEPSKSESVHVANGLPQSEPISRRVFIERSKLASGDGSSTESLNLSAGDVQQELLRNGAILGSILHRKAYAEAKVDPDTPNELLDGIISYSTQIQELCDKDDADDLCLTTRFPTASHSLSQDPNNRTSHKNIITLLASRNQAISTNGNQHLGESSDGDACVVDLHSDLHVKATSQDSLESNSSSCLNMKDLGGVFLEIVSSQENQMCSNLELKQSGEVHIPHQGETSSVDKENKIMRLKEVDQPWNDSHGERCQTDQHEFELIAMMASLTQACSTQDGCRYATNKVTLGAEEAQLKQPQRGDVSLLYAVQSVMCQSDAVVYEKTYNSVINDVTKFESLTVQRVVVDLWIATIIEFNTQEVSMVPSELTLSIDDCSSCSVSSEVDVTHISSDFPDELSALSDISDIDLDLELPLDDDDADNDGDDDDSDKDDDRADDSMSASHNPLASQICSYEINQRHSKSSPLYFTMHSYKPFVNVLGGSISTFSSSDACSTEDELMMHSSSSDSEAEYDLLLTSCSSNGFPDSDVEPLIFSDEEMENNHENSSVPQRSNVVSQFAKYISESVNQLIANSASENTRSSANGRNSSNIQSEKSTSMLDLKSNALDAGLNTESHWPPVDISNFEIEDRHTLIADYSRRDVVNSNCALKNGKQEDSLDDDEIYLQIFEINFEEKICNNHVELESATDGYVNVDHSNSQLRIYDIDIEDYKNEVYGDNGCDVSHATEKHCIGTETPSVDDLNTSICVDYSTEQLIVDGQYVLVCFAEVSEILLETVNELVQVQPGEQCVRSAGMSACELCRTECVYIDGPTVMEVCSFCQEQLRNYAENKAAVDVCETCVSIGFKEEFICGVTILVEQYMDDLIVRGEERFSDNVTKHQEEQYAVYSTIHVDIECIDDAIEDVDRQSIDNVSIQRLAINMDGIVERREIYFVDEVTMLMDGHYIDFVIPPVNFTKIDCLTVHDGDSFVDNVKMNYEVQFINQVMETLETQHQCDILSMEPKCIDRISIYSGETFDDCVKEREEHQYIDCVRLCNIEQCDDSVITKLEENQAYGHVNVTQSVMDEGHSSSTMPLINTIVNAIPHTCIGNSMQRSLKDLAEKINTDISLVENLRCHVSWDQTRLLHEEKIKVNHASDSKSLYRTDSISELPTKDPFTIRPARKSIIETESISSGTVANICAIFQEMNSEFAEAKKMTDECASSLRSSEGSGLTRSLGCLPRSNVESPKVVVNTDADGSWSYSSRPCLKKYDKNVAVSRPSSQINDGNLAYKSYNYQHDRHQPDNQLHGSETALNRRSSHQFDYETAANSQCSHQPLSAVDSGDVDCCTDLAECERASHLIPSGVVSRLCTMFLTIDTSTSCHPSTGSSDLSRKPRGFGKWNSSKSKSSPDLFSSGSLSRQPAECVTNKHSSVICVSHTPHDPSFNPSLPAIGHDSTHIPLLAKLSLPHSPSVASILSMYDDLDMAVIDSPYAHPCPIPKTHPICPQSDRLTDSESVSGVTPAGQSQRHLDPLCVSPVSMHLII